MAKSQIYTKDFFVGSQTGSKLSAMAMVPVVLELIKPRSVIDVGCATGIWLEVFQEYGLDEIFGIDGEYLDRNLLVIPQENFKAFDLARSFRLDRTYDLAICLEVAEHLASESSLDFIDSLTQLAPVILFSAAVPLQGGPHHVNEQWPEYWVQLFRAKGFVPVDALRKRIWSNPQIQWWYRQNTLLFCTEQVLASNQTLEREFRATNQNMLSIVHPELYKLIHWTNSKPIGPLLLIKDIIRKFLRKPYIV